MAGKKGSMGAAKIKPTSGTPLGGNSAGSNVMLGKNTASSQPLQKGSVNLGMKKIYRVPNSRGR